MSTGHQISLTFPGVPWTGGSNIHKSLAGGLNGLDLENTRRIMNMLLKDQVGSQIWEKLQQHFAKCEWLVSEEEFVALFLNDVYRWLKGGKSSKSPKMLRNPQTGNRFHRVALHGDIVGGVRFWAGWGIGNGHDLGFRFRLEKLAKKEEEETRRTIRESAVEAVQAVEEMIVELAISEPQTETETEKAKVRVKIELF